MKKRQTPLFNVLKEFSKKDKVSFHVPGHKNGAIFFDEAHSTFKHILEIDMTELTGLDDLHAPEGPIKEAQQLLANLYEADKSFFLVNGSTVGNLAMIKAVIEPGDTVLVQRNCHKSIIHGLILANANPIFIEPTYYEKWGVAGGLSLESIQTSLKLYPEVKAVIATYPNYYGVGEDLTDIITLAHHYGIPVLVDEAHGAHFSLGEPFPKSALSMGADIVVQSAHKTLPAMTMGSYLHIRSSMINYEKLAFYLQALQSSSPSYPIMASLDLARAYLESFTEDDRKALVEIIRDFVMELGKINEIEVLAAPNQAVVDPLKVTIRSTRGLSGFELQAVLEEVGVYSELADLYNVLLVMPLMRKQQADSFSAIIPLIRSAVAGKMGNCQYIESEMDGEIKGLELSYPEMNHKQKEAVNVKNAAGRVAAEMVIPYPPGIPLFMQGEKITQEKVNRLEKLRYNGARFHGGSLLSKGELIVYSTKLED